MSNTTYIGNGFSTNMLSDFPCDVRFTEITSAVAGEYVRMDAVSTVGHQSTADVYSDELGVSVPMNRSTVVLKAGDRLIIGQYRGPRLEEGAKHLPEGAQIKWILALIG